MNEDLQRAILEALLERYPQSVYEEELRQILHSQFPNEVDEDGWNCENPDTFTQEAYFLCELGAVAREEGERGYEIGWMKLTAKGKQYLQGTNGIVDYFNYSTGVTVKFDEKNIRTLLDYMTSRTSLSSQEQHTIREKLNKLSGKALKNIFDKLLDKAMDPNVVIEIMRNLPF